MIIGLTGFMRTGKSTVCEILEREHGFTVLGFADTLKAMALAINPYIASSRPEDPETLDELVEFWGWERAKDHPRFGAEVRRFLQRLGTDGVRDHLGPDTWVNSWRAKVDAFGDEADIAVPDVRFLNEANAVRAFGGEVWRIARPGFEGSGHVSETGQLKVRPDRLILNKGTVSELEDDLAGWLKAARQHR